MHTHTHTHTHTHYKEWLWWQCDSNIRDSVIIHELCVGSTFTSLLSASWTSLTVMMVTWTRSVSREMKEQWLKDRTTPGHLCVAEPGLQFDPVSSDGTAAQRAVSSVNLPDDPRWLGLRWTVDPWRSLICDVTTVFVSYESDEPLSLDLWIQYLVY